MATRHAAISCLVFFFCSRIAAQGAAVVGIAIIVRMTIDIATLQAALVGYAQVAPRASSNACQAA